MRRRRFSPARTTELYHERFCRITDMLSLPVLPALLTLALACLAALLLTLWVAAGGDRGEGPAQRKPAAFARRWAFAYATRVGSPFGRASARPAPQRGRPGGRGAPRARRRPRRPRSG